jgi:hypothetical protein
MRAAISQTGAFSSRQGLSNVAIAKRMRDRPVVRVAAGAVRVVTPVGDEHSEKQADQEQQGGND